MFDLEKSIAQWRAQMLAVGIQVAALDELETHLREEIERQVKWGGGQGYAFETAARQIGQPNALRSEFKKTQPIKKSESISCRFAIGGLLVSGIASLTLYLFADRPVHALFMVSRFSKTPLLDLYRDFDNSTFPYTNLAQEYLALSLILTLLFALVSFRLRRQP